MIRRLPPNSQFSILNSQFKRLPPSLISHLSSVIFHLSSASPIADVEDASVEVGAVLVDGAVGFVGDVEGLAVLVVEEEERATDGAEDDVVIAFVHL